MHSCLGVDEILRLLACKVVALKAKATAVSLACCCKGFENPVLDVLWERQHRLTPLLKCFPRDVWDEEGERFRIPTKAEWNNFEKHARRMQNLRVDTPKEPMAPDVFLALQLRTADKLFLPRLKNFECNEPTGAFIPFIPSLLSPKTTEVTITFAQDSPTVAVASLITRLTTLCPDLVSITLRDLPRSSVIVDAVSEMVLACNRATLQYFLVESPLTEEAREVVCQLPKLNWLWVVLQEAALLPPVILPNLALIDLEFGDHLNWLQGFRGAMFEELESIYFRSDSEQIGGFLEAFESVVLANSALATFSRFELLISSPWNPNYRSLLPFTQLKALAIEFSCDGDCSSSVDDDIIMDLARAMPKLEILRLGKEPCRTPGGVTIDGLIGLTCHCPHLSELRVHFQATSLVEAAATAVAQPPPDDEPVAQRGACALTDLTVGETPVPAQSVSRITSILLHIFPRILNVKYLNREWETIAENIKDFRRIGAFVHRSGDVIAIQQLLGDA